MTSCEKLTELVMRSEERIDKTNAMIDKLIRHDEFISSEYIKHINKLEDKLSDSIKQNGQLIQLVSDSRADYLKLLDKFEHLALTVGGTTFNVKK